MITATLAQADLSFPNETLTTVTFGSCHKRKYEDARIWQNIAQVPAQAWLWLGDAVYPPLRRIAPVSVLRDEYHALRQSQGYQALCAAVPRTLGTWDDHDYGGNDMGKHMPDREARRDAFFEFLGHPSAAAAAANNNNNNNNRHRRQGVYHAVTFGQAPQQVKIVFLDTRSFRDDHCGLPSVATYFPLGAGVACATRWATAGLLASYCRQQMATLLGDAQWTWLEHELATSQASLHIIVSSVQVLSTNPVMEGWCHFPSERTRLLRLLRQTTGALLLSGDVRYAEILDAASALVTEVTSSGLTHVCTKHVLYGPLCQPLLDAFGTHRRQPDGYYLQRNFGSLDIDWETSSVNVKIHDALSGNVVLQTGALPLIGRLPSVDAAFIDEIPTCMNDHLIPVAVAVLSGLIVLLLLWRRR